MLCNITIDKTPFTFPVEGDFFWGKDEVLFNEKDNLIENTNWLKDGYSVFPFFKNEEFDHIRHSVIRTLTCIGIELGVDLPPHFQPEEYHRYFNTQNLHQEVIKRTRFLTFRDFDIDFSMLCKRTAEFIRHPLQLENPLLQEEIVIMRISRPESLDINPLHRDGYLDLWENVLNLWVPLAGCNESSSLPVLPQSHYWNEKDIYRTQNKGASINGLTYHVPGIVSAKQGLHLIRPNPQPAEALVFTPFLIHGAAINQNEDITRMSLELRFHKK